MKNIGEPVELIFGHADVNGFERVGDNNSVEPLTDEELDSLLEKNLSAAGITRDQVEDTMYSMMQLSFKTTVYRGGMG